MKLFLICLFAISLAGSVAIVTQSFGRYGAALVERGAHLRS